MAIDPSYAGRTYPPTEPYEVGGEKIREFAAAIGDANPAYRDRAAAAGARAPGRDRAADVPVRADLPGVAARMIDDPELGLDYSRVVHGDQSFAYTRPVRAGDALTVDRHASRRSARRAATT